MLVISIQLLLLTCPRVNIGIFGAARLWWCHVLLPIRCVSSAAGRNKRDYWSYGHDENDSQFHQHNACLDTACLLFGFTRKWISMELGSFHCWNKVNSCSLFTKRQLLAPSLLSESLNNAFVLKHSRPSFLNFISICTFLRHNLIFIIQFIFLSNIFFLNRSLKLYWTLSNKQSVSKVIIICILYHGLFPLLHWHQYLLADQVLKHGDYHFPVTFDLKVCWA